MADVRLRFLGCGDAFASGGRFQTSFLLEGGPEPVMVDCGATTLLALKRHRIDPGSVGVVVLSHLHGDHFGGLPWLVIDGERAGRTRELVIAGPEGTEERFMQMFEVLYPGAPEGGWTFEVRVAEMAERAACDLGPVTVTTFPVLHAPRTFPQALRIEYGGKVIGFSGDTEWTDALLEVAAGADLFVCECNRFEGPGAGHLDYGTLSEKRSQLGCRRLVLTHMGDTMLTRLGSVDLETAEDGMVIEV